MSDFEDLDKEIEDPAKVDFLAREGLDHGGPENPSSRVRFLMTFKPHDKERMEDAIQHRCTQNHRTAVLLRKNEIQVSLSSNRSHHVPSSTSQPYHGNNQIVSTVANSIDNDRSVSTMSRQSPRIKAPPASINHYQHGSNMPFFRTPPAVPHRSRLNLWPQGVLARLTILHKQAEHEMNSTFHAGISQVYIMVKQAIDSLIHTRNHEHIVHQTRNVFLQIMGFATEQSKAKSSVAVIDICQNLGYHFGKGFQENAKSRGIQFFQNKADQEYATALQKFDVEIGVFVTRKLVELQAATARAQAYAARPPQKRQARGFRNTPAHAPQDITSTTSVTTPTNSQNTTSTTASPILTNPQYSQFDSLALPLELQFMVLKEATPSRLVLWNVGDLPPIVEALPRCRGRYLKINPPKIFRNHNDTYTKIHATGEDLVYITGKFPALKRSFTDVAVDAPTQIISPYTPSINGTLAGPICISPLLTIIAFSVHDAFHYFRHGGRSKANFNWKTIRKIFPLLVKMVFIFGYDRAHGKGFIQDLVFEQAVFNGNGY